jgi:hypothetical protein
MSDEIGFIGLGNRAQEVAEAEYSTPAEGKDL